MNIVSYLLLKPTFIFFLILILAALYLIYKIRQFNKPFDETDNDTPEVPLDAQFSTPQAPFPQPQKQLIIGDIPPAGKDANLQARISAIEEALKIIGKQIEMLINSSVKQSENIIPKNIIQSLESLPGVIDTISKTVASPKTPTPPVESPLVKEIAASVVSLQKQMLIFTQQISSNASGSGVPADIGKKLDSLAGLQTISQTLVPNLQKIDALGSQLNTAISTLNKLAENQSSQASGIPSETMAILKNLMISLDAVKSQNEKQPAGSGMSKELQDALLDVKKTIALKSADKGAEDFTALIKAIQELRNAYSAATDAEEEILSKITTKLDIIHQVLTSHTISGGGSSGMGDKDIF